MVFDQKTLFDLKKRTYNRNLVALFHVLGRHVKVVLLF